jgi:hypothetical protein
MSTAAPIAVLQSFATFAFAFFARALAATSTFLLFSRLTVFMLS